MKKITIAKERLSREKMSGNLPSNEILEKYKFKNGYEITDLGNGYVDIKKKTVRGLRSKVGILEEVCKDDSKILLNEIGRLRKRLSKEGFFWEDDTIYFGKFFDSKHNIVDFGNVDIFVDCALRSANIKEGKLKKLFSKNETNGIYTVGNNNEEIRMKLQLEDMELFKNRICIIKLYCKDNDDNKFTIGIWSAYIDEYNRKHLF